MIDLKVGDKMTVTLAGTRVQVPGVITDAPANKLCIRYVDDRKVTVTAWFLPSALANGAGQFVDRFGNSAIAA